MVFTSHIFIFYFLPFVLLAYYLLPRGWRNLFLTLVSYIFYGWWKPWFVFLMMLSTVVDYACGRTISARGASRNRRLGALLTSILANLGLLAFFKYYMFTVDNLNRLLLLFGSDALPILQTTLPIGISFYTFQSMSYTIDLYRGEALPVRSFSDLSCFVALFPQLIAGPIIRYNTIADQLDVRDHTWEKFSSGVGIFILGFTKKIMLANPMGHVADAVFAAESPPVLDAWFGVIAYAFQIYFDFSGYSDMAIGLGRLLGFRFPKNFASPYRAESITDFWRRWHISLSSFLRDYLYIPLGGNKVGTSRTYMNLMIVMLLGGLWHGANWVFVTWGAYHGVLLSFERWRGKKTVYSWLPRWGRVGITFVLVLFSWVLFRSPTFTHAYHYLGAMLGATPVEKASFLLAAQIYTPANLTLMALCAFFAFHPAEADDWVSSLSLARAITLVVVFVLAIMQMFTQAFNPFLYFQF
ncbi:MBOAT family protein [Acidobacteria bacterium AH-259-G07]|nr:MBOAT family protein [Acidobacteria bacterium AH-259-G07]